MISLQNISFHYPKRRNIFINLSLTLSKGHIYGLLGKNGEGKTTLLKIMAGLRFAQQGKSTILGEAADWRYPNVLQSLYFLAEEPFIPPISINHFVKAYAPFYPNFSHEQFDYFLQEFEVVNQNDFLNKLSHGQKKKVLIAFALATNTPILIMDEPTNGLDIPSKTVFRRLISNCITDDKLVIISTHQVRDLHSIIDTIIILDRGEILLNETAESITEKLLFEVKNEADDDPNILYTEENLRGVLAVKENLQHVDNKLDIELFFNAVLQNKERIKTIFSR